MRKILIVSTLIVVIVVATELLLRLQFGFTHAPLYQASPNYEYIAQPNQQGMRFGNRYYINSYSQRSDEPQSGRPKILGLGDSVIFAGMQSDQDSIATSIITRESPYQMLNISAGSWGADNCAAYLEEHGIFGARAMILVASSHDAHDNMEFVPVVGVAKSYPSERYKLAWVELFDRYIIPRLFKVGVSAVNPDSALSQAIHKGGERFNSGFDHLLSIAQRNDIQLVIYLHAELNEITHGDYNSQGYEILNWAAEHGVKVVRSLDHNPTRSHYRDAIHLNEGGQRSLADVIMSEIITEIDKI